MKEKFTNLYISNECNAKLHTKGASRIENGRNENVTYAIQLIFAVKFAVKTN